MTTEVRGADRLKDSWKRFKLWAERQPDRIESLVERFMLWAERQLDRLYELLNRPWLTGLFVAAAIGFVFAFRHASSWYRGSGDPDIVELQLAGNAEAFADILTMWVASVPSATSGVLRTVLIFDYLFPVVYAMALAGLIAILFDGKRPSCVGFVIVLPFAAAVFDWIENTIHVGILAGLDGGVAIDPTSISLAAVTIASWSAVLKMACLTASIALFLAGIVVWLLRRFKVRVKTG